MKPKNYDSERRNAIKQAKKLQKQLNDATIQYRKVLASGFHFGYVGGSIDSAIKELNQGIDYQERLLKEIEEN